MRHFYRSHLSPADVLASGDEFFPALGLAQITTAPRSRTYSGPLGALKLSARAEGGHYTFVQVDTDQMGESRLDRNVKKFFVTLHRVEDPAHAIAANY
jgi:hypothetical protein